MRLYSGKISPIVDEILTSLEKDGDIELEQKEEARLDLEAVLKEFVRRERSIVDEAKARMEREGLSYSMLGKLKSRVAKETGFPPSDETLPYILDQLVTMLFHSNNIAEIFAEDVALRKKMTPILRRHMEVESELDKEVRGRIKNLSEGTASFEIEYAKVLEQIKRKKGLS
ncbi:MAG: DUF507 family protein [Myxococcales bacterium]|nr:DUF507 family protein [Myxococcales bacterium]